MKSYKDIEIEIKKVEIVRGKDLKANWQSDMQKIETNQGLFIDNMPGIKKNINSPEGFDWKTVEGRKIKAKFVFNSDYNWLTPNENIGISTTTKSPKKLIPSFTLAKQRQMKSALFHQKIAEAGYIIKNEAGLYMLTDSGMKSGMTIKENTYGQYFMLPEHLTF